jgi:hypothetical protein
MYWMCARNLGAKYGVPFQKVLCDDQQLGSVDPEIVDSVLLPIYRIWVSSVLGHALLD